MKFLIAAVLFFAGSLLWVSGGLGLTRSCAPHFMLGYLACGALIGGALGYLIGRMRRRRDRDALPTFNRWRGQK